MFGVASKENCFGTGVSRAEVQIAGLLPVHGVTSAMMGNFDHRGFWQVLATVASMGAVPVLFQCITTEQNKTGAPMEGEDGRKQVGIGEASPFSAHPASVNMLEFIANGFIGTKAMNLDAIDNNRLLVALEQVGLNVIPSGDGSVQVSQEIGPAFSQIMSKLLDGTWVVGDFCGPENKSVNGRRGVPKGIDLRVGLNNWDKVHPVIGVRMCKASEVDNFTRDEGEYIGARVGGAGERVNDAQPAPGKANYNSFPVA